MSYPTCKKCSRWLNAGDLIATNSAGEYYHAAGCPESVKDIPILIFTVDAVKQFLASKCTQADRQKIYEFLHNSLDCRMR